MYDAAPPLPAPAPPTELAPHQRAQGELRITWRARGDTTALDDFRQQGCLKARLPRPEHAGWASAVMLNSSGGVAAGDALDVHLGVAAGAQACVASQAAERFYRALPDAAPARLRTVIEVSAGAALEYLPQEAILFDGCALDRRLDIALEDGAWFLGLESLVYGRTAMGEQVATARLADTIALRRGGRLVLHDAIRIDGAVAAALDRPAVGAGGRAISTLILACDGAAAQAEALRAAVAGLDGVEAGVSAWDGMLLARIVGRDGAWQRRAVVAGLAALRAGRPLPRVWQC